MPGRAAEERRADGPPAGAGLRADHHLLAGNQRLVQHLRRFGEAGAGGLDVEDVKGVQAQLAAQVAGAEDAVVGDQGQRVDLARGRAREDQLHRQRLLTVAYLQLGHLFQARAHVLWLEALVGVDVEIDAVADRARRLRSRCRSVPQSSPTFTLSTRTPRATMRSASARLASISPRPRM